MGMFLFDFLIVFTTFIIVGGIFGFLAVSWATDKAKRDIAKIGDEYGSIYINGHWYVIKREGE